MSWKERILTIKDFPQACEYEKQAIKYIGKEWTVLTLLTDQDIPDADKIWAICNLEIIPKTLLVTLTHKWASGARGYLDDLDLSDRLPDVYTITGLAWTIASEAVYRMIVHAEVWRKEDKVAAKAEAWAKQVEIAIKEIESWV